MDQEQEQPKTKAELFAENPDRFEDLQGVLLVVKRHPEDGRLMVLNQIANTDDCWLVKGYVEQQINIRAAQCQMKQEAMNPKIVKANGHGIINGARNLFKK
jgi:hypothetical protein